MVALGDLGGSDAGFIFLMRMQVLALFAWGAAGVVGVLIGDRVRYSSGTAKSPDYDVADAFVALAEGALRWRKDTASSALARASWA